MDTFGIKHYCFLTPHTKAIFVRTDCQFGSVCRFRYFYAMEFEPYYRHTEYFCQEPTYVVRDLVQ